MKLFYCFILLVIHSALGQNLLPYNLSTFQDGATVFVSPCGVAVVSFRVNTTFSRYYWTLTLTSVTSAQFNMGVSLKGPNGPTLDYTQCAPVKSCSTPANGGTCNVGEGCGDESQTWFAYVETTGPVQGQFQLSLKVQQYPNQTFVTVDNDANVLNFTRYGGSPVGAGLDTLSQYDFYTFTLQTRPPGTVLDFEIKPESGTMNSVLYRSTSNANIFAGCFTPTVNRTRLSPCEVAGGGTWSLAIERTQDNQFYLLRLWYTDGINFQLSENVPKATQLRKVDDFVYFKYTVPNFANTPSTTQRQIYFILDNVVGGIVEIEALFNQKPGTQCGTSVKCKSKEGCHITVEHCQAIPASAGFYTIVARAVQVFQNYIDVSFQVRGYSKSIDVLSLPAGTNIRGSLKLSEYGALRFTQNSTTNNGDWIDIELYYDRDVHDDVPATMFVGTAPFPTNGTSFRGCGGNFYKKCDATVWMGNQRWCFIQLDPCELELFTNGVYVGVYSNNQVSHNTSDQEHTYLQNPMDYTIYTTVRNPNNFRINHGTVITDEVTETWKKAYRIDDSIRNGRLEIAISANYHYVFPTDDPIVTENDTSRVELDIDIVYAQKPYIGPRCLSCYRVQQSRSVSLFALQTYKFEVEKCVQGVEHVYLVITGNNTRSEINRTQFNFTDNRYVITAKNLPISPVEIIRPGEFSNIISQESAFGGLQYWILNFDKNLLKTSTLSLKLRAHPRSGRQICLNIADSFDPACADPNFPLKCGSTFPSLQYCCHVNDTNKGYCFINIQVCDLIPQIGRTFYVEARSLLGFANLTTPNVTVEYAYSFTYDLIPAVATPVTLGQHPNRGLETQVIVDLEAEIYKHFSVDIPTGSVGRDTFFIEAYFDSNNLYASLRPITLYLNPPSQISLAGLPSHSRQCLCFTRTESDLNKVVMIIDRCELEAGRYYFSLFTTSHGFKEGTSHVTVKTYVHRYVQDITFEDPHDLSLFFGEPAAYKFDIDANLLSDNGRTDKELQVWIFTNREQYNATIQYRLTNNIGTCGCGGSLNDINYQCENEVEDTRSTQFGRCDIITGYCQLRQGPWYIITQVTEPDPLTKPVDRHQVVPFTLTATKANTITTVRQLVLAPSTSTCDNYDSRRRNMQNITVKTEEYIFFDLRGQNPIGFNIYIDNVTFGTLTAFTGINLPTRNCSISAIDCSETPQGGGQACIIQFPGPCTTANYLGIKVVSNDQNKDVRFQISSCINNNTATVAASTLTFNNLAGTTVTISNNAVQPINFNFGALNPREQPFVIISITTNGGGSFVATFSRAQCGGCGGFASLNCTSTGSNCTIYIPFCNLPSDFQASPWTISIQNNGGQANFTAVAYAVPNNIGNLNLITNQDFPFNVQPNSWTNVIWNLNVPELCPFGTCTQTSNINFNSNSPNLLRFINDGTGLPTSCLQPFTNDSFFFSSCCTTPASRVYSFFNADFTNVATMVIRPTLITQSQNHTTVIWQNGQASQNVVAPGTTQAGATLLVEYFLVMPGIPQYGTLIFQHNFPAGVTIYLQRNFLAGPAPPNHGGCFNNEFQPGSPFTLFACSGSTSPLSLQSNDVYFPQGIWVGIENTQNVQQTGAFNFTFIAPIRVTNNTPSRTVTTINTVNQQFIYTPSPNVAYNQRVIRFNVTVTDGTVVMYVNRRNASGPNGGCTANIASTSQTSAPSTAIINVDTCPDLAVTTDTYYIGVIPSSTTATYFITVTEINKLVDQNTPAINLQLGAVFFNNAPAQTTNYDFRTGVIPPNSYLRVSLDNISFGSTYVIKMYRDGTCQEFENTFCGETANFGYKCSGVLGGCQLQDNTIYHIVIEGSQSYTILAEIITFGAGGLQIQTIPTPPGNPGELLKTTFQGSVDPHGLALYQVVLPPSQVLPGENVRLFIESFICGAVDAYGYVGGPPGPFCSTDDGICGPAGNPAAGCLITQLNQCDTFRASSRKANWATDLYVLVRGKAHTNGNIAIRYTFKVERSGSFVVRHFYYLEKHQIFPVQPTPPSTISPAVCPTSRVPAPLACCPAGGGGGNSWIWQPTVFYFPVEGERFLNDFFWQRLKIAIDSRLSPFIATATLSVWNQHPSFCPQDFPNRVQNPGLFTQCTVTSAKPNCTVNLQIPICGLADSHLLFFTVDNIQFSTPNLPATVAGFKEGITLSHTRIPNVIIPIFYKDTPQYFEDDLSPLEVQYFKVFHNQFPGKPNYHFHVQLIRVSTGTIALNHHWSECPGNTVCVSNNCQDVDPFFNSTNDCKIDPDCVCDYEQMPCRGGDLNAAQEGFFTLRGISTTGGFDVAHYVIKVTFVEPLESILTVVCGNETCEDERYYNNVPPAGPEELYRFRITSVNGKSNILIAHDNVIGLDGYDNNNVQGPSCQRTRTCDSLVDGRLEECVTFYRTVADGTPYVSVLTTANCTNHVTTRFNLTPDKHTPRIQQLTDGQLQDSIVTTPVGNCSTANQTYWYKIQTTKGSYMVVELWSLTGETMQLWVTPRHVSWNAFNENLAIGCQTASSGTQGAYCRYIIACNYTPGLFYIQVSDSSPLPKLHPYFRHQIRVTTMDPIDTPLQHLNDVSLTLSNDLRQIHTVTISNVNGQEVQPWQDLIAYTFSQTIHDSWMTRNKFGDATCAVSSYRNRTGGNNHVVSECQVDNNGGIFKVHFIVNPNNICANSRLASVSSRFNSPGTPIIQTNSPNTRTPMTINPGQTYYIKHTIPGGLKDTDIVYSALTNFDTRTRLTTTMWKGNHLNTDRQTYALPCSPGCTQGPREASTHLAWGDICYHCGGGLYDTIFVQVDANVYTGNTSLINVIPFSSTLSVLQPTPLTPSPLSVTHAKEEPSLKFFTAQYTRDRGSRIELVINKGGAIGVEINVYAQTCGLRTPPSQYWCHPGHFCTIPVPENHNFGDHYINTGITSPYISQTQLLVVRAIDASYTINQVTSTATCAAITTATAPFCSAFQTVVARTMWGNTNTFPQKDYNAREFYDNLTKAFSCPDGQDHCDCNFLTQPCLTNLAIYACLSHFNPCDSNGLELQPSGTDCLNVENTCFKTFRCAGYPERECGNSFYFVPATPTRAPTGSAPLAPLAPGQTRPPTAPTPLAPLAPGQTRAPTTPSQRVPTVSPPGSNTRRPTSPVVTVPPAGVPTPVAPTPIAPTAPTTPNSVQGNFPQWVPAVTIFLVVMVAVLLVAVIIGGVLLCTGAAHGPGEMDAYQAL